MEATMENRTRKDFAKEIRHIRKKNHVRQMDVAKRMRVAQARISLIEKGRCEPFLFEMIEYSYLIGSGPNALMKIAASSWCKNHELMISNPELLMCRTHTLSPHAQASPAVCEPAKLEWEEPLAYF